MDSVVVSPPKRTGRPNALPIDTGVPFTSTILAFATLDLHGTSNFRTNPTGRMLLAAPVSTISLIGCPAMMASMYGVTPPSDRRTRRVVWCGTARWEQPHAMRATSVPAVENRRWMLTDEWSPGPPYSRATRIGQTGGSRQAACAGATEGEGRETCHTLDVTSCRVAHVQAGSESEQSGVRRERTAIVSARSGPESERSAGRSERAVAGVSGSPKPASRSPREMSGSLREVSKSAPPLSGFAAANPVCCPHGLGLPHHRLGLRGKRLRASPGGKG